MANLRPATEALREPTTATIGRARQAGSPRTAMSGGASSIWPSRAGIFRLAHRDQRRVGRDRRREFAFRLCRRGDANRAGRRGRQARARRRAHRRHCRSGDQFAESDRPDVLAADQPQPGKALGVTETGACPVRPVHRRSPILPSLPAASRAMFSAWRSQRMAVRTRKRAAASFSPDQPEGGRGDEARGQRRRPTNSGSPRRRRARPRAKTIAAGHDRPRARRDRSRRPCRRESRARPERYGRRRRRIRRRSRRRGAKACAISTAAVPFSASSRSVAAARLFRPVRSTLVAPILPEPMARMSPRPAMRVTTRPKGIEPSR